MKFGAKRDPPASTVRFFFAPNFIQNLYAVLKKRLWESRSTPTLALPSLFGASHFSQSPIHYPLYREDHKVVRLFANKKTFLIIAEIQVKL
jgi:hypothetical protein